MYIIKTQRLVFKIFKSITQKTAKSNPLLVGASILGIRSYRFLIYLNQFKVFNDGIDFIQNLGVTKVLKSRAQFNLGLQFYTGASFYSQVLEFPPSQDQCEKVVIFYQRLIFYSPSILYRGVASFL